MYDFFFFFFDDDDAEGGDEDFFFFFLLGILNEWVRHLLADQQTFLISTKYMQKLESEK